MMPDVSMVEWFPRDITEYDMKTFVVGLALLCLGSGSSRDANNAATVKTPPRRCYRVGQLIIVGNTRTKQSVILDQIGLYPGQVLSRPEVCAAEKRLTKLGIFKSSPDGAIHPSIDVEDDPNCPNSEYKNVIIHVEEDNTAQAQFKPGFDSKGAWVYHILVEERNWDPFRWPTSKEDIAEGRAFRGAGLAIGVDFQFKVPLHPVSVPSVFLRITVPHLSLTLNESWLLTLLREKTRP